ncbi:MAG: DUF1579 domain-containing protein [Ignavibacteriae bacterium]|nr:DUF1579 domain-containing protein [Ignavibacteriota bacterium]
MKKTLLFVLLIAFYAINSFAQDDEMKKWMDYATPGKEHQSLAKMNGEWSFTSKMWMDPNAEPQISTGTAKFEMLLGGRYQQLTVTGKMMGMDFIGIGINGFDNAKKVYVSSWIDNVGTGLMFMEGKFDEASKKIIFKGVMVDPMTGKDTEYKETIKAIDDNNMEMEMFTVTDGKDIKNMEIKYTRK